MVVVVVGGAVIGPMVDCGISVRCRVDRGVHAPVIRARVVGSRVGVIDTAVVSRATPTVAGRSIIRGISASTACS